MSGSKKRWIYYLCDLLFYAAAVTAAATVFLETVPQPPQAVDFFALSFFLLALIFNLPALLHEAGHLLFGLCAGMKLAGFHYRPFSRSSTEMFPKDQSHVRTKFLIFAFGGAIFNLLLGGAFYAVYFCLDYHPALLFLGLMAPFLLYEGIRALLPAELPAGKTDGAVILGVLKGEPEEDIMLRVLKAQGILYRNTFEQLPRELLYDVPVVREDLPAFAALLLIRLEYEIYHEDSKFEETLARLESLEEYFSPEQKSELEFFRGDNGAQETKKEPLYGVRDLKLRMAERPKK